MKLQIKHLILIAVLSFLTSCNSLQELNKNDSMTALNVAPDVYEVYIEGKPQVDYRIEGGIYLWRTANTWSIRFARPIALPRPVVEGTIFSGNILIEHGLIANLITHNLSPQNIVRIRGGNTILLKLDVKEQVEGFEFTVQPINTRYCVTIDIKVNGIYAPEFLRLGKFMHRSNFIPLKICVKKS